MAQEEHSFDAVSRVDAAEVEGLLGVPRFLREEVERKERIGLATGLAWSEAGGALLQIEVGVLPGRGWLGLEAQFIAFRRHPPTPMAP